MQAFPELTAGNAPGMVFLAFAQHGAKRTAWEYHAAAEPVRAASLLRAGELTVSLEELFSSLDTAPLKK